MRYVLGRECQHEGHEGDGKKCSSISYLHTHMTDEDGNEMEERTVKVFESKHDALDFMKEYRFSPRIIMVIPYEEGIYE